MRCAWDEKFKPQSDAGFTLLELMIAVAILGLLSVLLFSSLQFGTKVWARSEGAAGDTNAIRAVQTLLINELGHAYPEFLAKNASDPHVDFEGTTDSVSFLAPDEGVPGAMRRVNIGLAQSDEGLLVQSVQLELAAETAENQPKTEILLHGVQSLEFSYFGAEGPDSAPSWQTEWRDRKSLPLLIKVRAFFLGKTASPWPELIVAPRISADVSCVYDALSKGCQGR